MREQLGSERSFLFCSLLVLFLWVPAHAQADFFDPVAAILDGDTLETLHNHHPECIRLPQPQHIHKKGATHSTVKMGKRTFWCAVICHMGKTKLDPPAPQTR